MSVMRAIKVRETYKEWFKTVIKFTLSSSSLKPLSIEYVNDVYRGISAKNCSRDEREKSETRVHLQSLEQKMLSNKGWLTLFHNIKISNISLVYLQLISVVMILYSQVRCQYSSKKENETFKISSSATKVFDCNPEEVNTRMIFHALQQKTSVGVYSKDTDVIVLIIFAYALNKINEKWVMKIETNKFIYIRKTAEYFSKATPNSYSYRV